MSFLFFLTVYILYSEPYNTVRDGGAASNTTDPFSFNDSNITSGINDTGYWVRQEYEVRNTMWTVWTVASLQLWEREGSNGWERELELW